MIIKSIRDHLIYCSYNRYYFVNFQLCLFSIIYRYTETQAHISCMLNERMYVVFVEVNQLLLFWLQGKYIYNKKEKLMQATTMMPRWAVKAILLTVIISIPFSGVSATNHTVGGPTGWDLSSNIHAWSATATFHVGDTLGIYIHLHALIMHCFMLHY